MFIQRFINRRPYFTPIRAEVTTSFEKLADEPSQFKGKILMLLEKPLKSKTVQLVKFKVARATKKIFSVARGQMLVASGDRAPLEHSLAYSPYCSLCIS